MRRKSAAVSEVIPVFEDVIGQSWVFADRVTLPLIHLDLIHASFGLHSMVVVNPLGILFSLSNNGLGLCLIEDLSSDMFGCRTRYCHNHCSTNDPVLQCPNMLVNTEDVFG